MNSFCLALIDHREQSVDYFLLFLLILSVVTETWGAPETLLSVVTETWGAPKTPVLLLLDGSH